MSPELQALVEKVARAICEADPECGEWKAANSLLKGALRTEALAAIRCVAEATREASEGMMCEGWFAAHRVLTHNRCNNEMLSRAYRAMHAASVLGEALRHE